MKSKLLPFYLLLWLGIMPAAASAQAPHYKSFEVNRETHPTVNVLFEDSEGFIWLGTDEGLYYFNGLEFHFLSPPVALENDPVTALAQDTSGNIWIGYRSGHLAIASDKRITLFEPEEGTPRRPITGIVVDKGGRIWFSTYGEGLYIYNGQYIYNYGIEDGLVDTAIYAITIDAQGNIWAGTDAGISICSMNGTDKTIENLTEEDGLPDNLVQALITDSEGNIWIGMYDKGVCKYDIKKKQFMIPSLMKQWDGSAVTSLAIFDNYDLWIGTAGNGLVEMVLDAKPTLRYLNAKSGFYDAKVQDLLKDAEGNIWIAANVEGLFMFNKKIEFLSEYKGTEIRNVQAIMYDREGILWFSNREGLFHFDVNDKGERILEKINIGTGGSTDLIISIYEDRDGYIWLGTFGNGVYRFHHETNSFKKYTESDGLSNNNVLSISGTGNEIWFATLGGVSKGVLPDDPSGDISFQSYSEKEGLGSNYIYYVFIDSKGREWFATDGKGITLLDRDGTFRNFTMEDGLKSEIIYSITEDKQGNIWFSTNNAGIYRYDGSTFSNFNLDHGLRDLSISSLATDIKGNIIIVHRSGIDVLDPTTGSIIYYAGDLSTIALDPDLNAISKDRSGNIWIGTQAGIIKYSNFREETRKQPEPILSKIMVFLNEVPRTKKRFAYDENHIAFEYIGIWYQDPENVIYQHRLEGYDLEWITSRDRISSYSNLPPGDYTFRLRAAADQNFEVAKEITYSFTIGRPLWMQPWFIILVISTSAALLYWYIKDRERRLRKVERLEKDRIEFQFQTLKNQVNPHFLFNSFNTLMNIIDEDKVTASKYVERLSDFFRSILAYREKELITIGEELEIIQNYYYLQQQRYEENFTMKVDIDEENMDDYIPPLTLQLLVENAIKHNIISRSKPLLVEIFTEDNYIVVRNNLQRKKETEPSTKVGLQNIINRYRFLTDQTIKMEESNEYYAVHLPIIKQIR